MRDMRAWHRLVLTLAIASSVFANSALTADGEPDASSAEHYVFQGGVTLSNIHAEHADWAKLANTQDLYLDVYHDDRPIGLIAHMRLRNGQLSATADELRAIGLMVPAETPADSDGLIGLDTLSGLSYRYDSAMQRLILHIPPSLRPLQRLGYQVPEAVDVRRDSGWLIDYEIYGRRFDDNRFISAGHTMRYFGPAGAVELSGVSRAGDDSDVYRRLDTFWTYSDPDRLWTWTVGDLISGGLPWTRPVRMGGVQWRRNFGVRPDLITLPMPRFTADAALPSSVDLYVNNIQQFGSDVQDGPFVLDTLPRISGAGEASLIVTDALGRVTQTVLPLYLDHLRLAPGLSDFSVEAGFLRRNFGSEDDSYESEPAASFSWRRGMTDTFTIESHGEIGLGTRMAGVGAVWSPANRWGALTGSYSRSSGDTDGDQHTLGYQWNAPAYGIDLHHLRRSAGFRDLGDAGLDTTATAPSLRAQDRATFWVPTRRGSFAFTWLRWRNGEEQSHRTRSISWTQIFASSLSLSMSLFDDDDSGRGGGLILSKPLGDDLYASVSTQRSGGRMSTIAELRQNAPYQGGWGWTIQAGDRPGAYAQAAAEVRSRYGEARFGIEHFDGQPGAFFYGGGSIVLMDGHVFLSRRIYDAFAVVSTQGVPDVLIRNENRAYARTNDDGYLLVPELRGWQRNRLAIDPDDLGPNYRLGELEQFATPADRSGVLVDFLVARLNPAIVILLTPDEQPVMAGSRGVLTGTGREVMVGFDGETYIDDVSKDTTIELVVDGVHCRYYLPRPDTITNAAIRRDILPCVATPP